MTNALPSLRLVALFAVGAMLTACAGSPRSYSRSTIDRALASAPYAAQPSEVVAREIAFARAAREDGQWTAFRAFAASGALLHGPSGPTEAVRAIAGRANPSQAVEWAPRTVVISCDGKLAVSRGRFLDPEGYVGTYVTVWARDDYEDEYHWAHNVSGRDASQPSREEEEGAILVTAYDDIQGLVADCPRAGANVPAPEMLAPPANGRAGDAFSPDGTLRWNWEHRADGTKYIRADYYTGGAWQTVINESLASLPQ